MSTGIRIAAIVCILRFGLAVGMVEEDVKASVQQQFQKVEHTLHTAAQRLNSHRQARRLSPGPRRPPTGKPCVYANSKCSGDIAFADKLAANADASVRGMWTSEKLCMGMSVQTLCDASPACSWKTSACDVSDATMAGMSATIMAPMIAGCGTFGTAMAMTMSCAVHEGAACSAASTCQTKVGKTPEGGACVNKTECESSKTIQQALCGADHPADSFETCFSTHNMNVTLTLACVSEACATEGDMYVCGFTSDETACTQNPKCLWKDTACEFNIETLLPDGCGLKAVFSNSCEATTQAGCTGNCTWFSTEETCSDEGVYRQGTCQISSQAMFPDGDKSQIAFADLEYTLKSCKDQTTEAACSGFAAPGLLGDYSQATVVGNHGIRMQSGVASFVVAAVGFLVKL